MKQKPTLQAYFRKHYRIRMTLLMLVSDLLGFTLVGAILFFLDRHIVVFVLNSLLLEFVVVFLVGISLFAFSRLYPGVGVNPAEEMRMVYHKLSVAFTIGLLLLTLFHQAAWQQYLIFGGAWLFLPACILLIRWGVRIPAVLQGLWCEPVAVLGYPADAARLVTYFTLRRRLGFEPVLVITPKATESELPVPAISLDKARLEAGQFIKEEINTLLVDPSAVYALQNLTENRALFDSFKNIILVTDLVWLGGVSLLVNDLEGLVGIEARRNILRRTDLLVKRLMDLLLGLILGVLALPLILLIGILIKLDTPGPLFFRQERLGKGGQSIHIYKLRTMVQDADSVLRVYLEENPQAHREWEQTQKLKDDPRITRVGKWLRKLSLDELPQIYNVLIGEMSLVGPRPIVADEISHYGRNYALYTSVRPGLTGLWQVSGRNNTSYPERVRFDAYYVHNWSIWLDVYILLRTLWVVLRGDGAY